MKIDLKLGIIILLVGALGVTIGLLMGKQAPSKAEAQPYVGAAADDGKLAKEYKEKVVVKTIIENAKDIQACYLDFLKDKKSVQEGVVNVLMKVEEDGRIGSVKITKNEFQDEKMGQCLEKKISTYYFSPPPLGINRFIAHSLAFKSEETAKHEAEERAKAGPPKILPVN